MEYQISDIQSLSPEKGKKYFFDANVWFFYFNTLKPRSRQKKYIRFLEEILEFNDSPKPKIVISNMLISEVINRSLRSIEMPKYAKSLGLASNKIPRDFYKKTYRVSDKFCFDYEKHCNNFRNLIPYFEFSKDCSDVLRPKEILNTSILNLDFNDQLFFQFAKKYGYIVVTDDGDFWVKNVKIITANNKLLSKQREIEKKELALKS